MVIGLLGDEALTFSFRIRNSEFGIGNMSPTYQTVLIGDDQRGSAVADLEPVFSTCS